MLCTAAEYSLFASSLNYRLLKLVLNLVGKIKEVQNKGRLMVQATLAGMCVQSLSASCASSV